MRMSKYCAKCGKEISDTTTFCPACGAKVMLSKPVTPCGQSKKTTHNITKNTSILAGVVIVALLFVVVFGIKSFLKPGYDKPIKLLEKGINEASFSKMKGALSPGVIENEFGVIPDYVTDEQLDDALRNEIQSDFGIGAYKVEFKVNGKEKIGAGNLSQTLRESYAINDSDANQAKAAYLLSVKITATVDSIVESQNVKMVVIKIGGTWYIANLDF